MKLSEIGISITEGAFEYGMLKTKEKHDDEDKSDNYIGDNADVYEEDEDQIFKTNKKRNPRKRK